MNDQVNKVIKQLSKSERTRLLNKLNRVKRAKYKISNNTLHKYASVAFLLSTGMEMCDVADELNISISSISRIARKFNLRRNNAARFNTHFMKH